MKNEMTDNESKKYFKRFGIDYENGSVDTKKERKVLKKALAVALDTRKFEIELYWKRATYFWAFIAAIFAAYFIAIDKKKDIPLFMPLLISVLGYFFSLGWYFVNRGSKFWQENWESHVDLLGKKIHGNLFNTIKKTNSSFFKNFDKEYPFSVSKVNQLLSLLMVCTWIGLFGYSFFSFLNNFNIFENCCCLLFSILVLICVLFPLTYCFFKKSKSSNKGYKGKKGGEEFLYDN